MVFICDCTYGIEIKLKNYDGDIRYEAEDKSPLTSDIFSCPNCDKDWEIRLILEFHNTEDYDWPPGNRGKKKASNEG